MDASSWDDWERSEGYVAVSAMIGGGQHAQTERMLTRHALSVMTGLAGHFPAMEVCSSNEMGPQVPRIWERETTDPKPTEADHDHSR